MIPILNQSFMQEGLAGMRFEIHLEIQGFYPYRGKHSAIQDARADICWYEYYRPCRDGRGEP